MPRDKTESHEKIVTAAIAEFREKGFEQASMKSVADAVGMTSAALYRHFPDKQGMFAALVQPALEAVNEWKQHHVEASYECLTSELYEQLWSADGQFNDMDLILEVMYSQLDAFYLLLFCSGGTPYENTVHDMVEENTDSMMAFFEVCREKGFPVKALKRDEMHMLISAYLEAMLQPIAHGYPKADAESYLHTIIAFFMKGWRDVAGLT